MRVVRHGEAGESDSPTESDSDDIGEVDDGWGWLLSENLGPEVVPVVPTGDGWWLLDPDPELDPGDGRHVRGCPPQIGDVGAS